MFHFPYINQVHNNQENELHCLLCIFIGYLYITEMLIYFCAARSQSWVTSCQIRTGRTARLLFISSYGCPQLIIILPLLHTHLSLCVAIEITKQYIIVLNVLKLRVPCLTRICLVTAYGS